MENGSSGTNEESENLSFNFASENSREATSEQRSVTAGTYVTESTFNYTYLSNAVDSLTITDETSKFLEDVSNGNATLYADSNSLFNLLGQQIQPVPLEISLKVKIANRDEHISVMREGDRDGLSVSTQLVGGDLTLSLLFNGNAVLDVSAERHEKVNIVGLIGEAGSGKTTQGCMFIKCVSDKKALSNVKYIFRIALRDVNFGVKMSILEFLMTGRSLLPPRNEHLIETIQFALRESHDVLIVLDGLDEVANSAKVLKDRAPKMMLHSREFPVIILKNILSGNVFPNSKVLVTSRPRAMYSLHQDYRPRALAEVNGLNQENQDQVGQQMCGVPHYDEVKALLSEYHGADSLCCLPLSCVLVIACMADMVKEGTQKEIQSMTEVMTHALSMLVRSNHLGDTADIQELLRKVCSLANKVTKQSKSIFQLAEFGINPVSVQAFIHTYIDKRCEKDLKDRLFDGDQHSSFSHQIVQYFFSAVHVAYFMSAREFQSIQPQLLGQRFEVILQCLFGLCFLPQERSKLQNILPNRAKVAQGKREGLKKLIAEYLKYPSPLKVITASAWANEARDALVTKEVIDNLPRDLQLTRRTLHPSTAASIAYVIYQSKCSFSVDLSHTTFIRNSFDLIVSAIKTYDVVPGPSSSEKTPAKEDQECSDPSTSSENIRQQNTITKLNLRGCKLNSMHIKTLAEKLGTIQQPLDEIDLSYNGIEFEGVVHLKKCMVKVRQLDIRKCKINVAGISELIQKKESLPHPKPTVIGLELKIETVPVRLRSYVRDDDDIFDQHDHDPYDDDPYDQYNNDPNDRYDDDDPNDQYDDDPYDQYDDDPNDQYDDDPNDRYDDDPNDRYDDDDDPNDRYNDDPNDRYDDDHYDRSYEYEAITITTQQELEPEDDNVVVTVGQIENGISGDCDAFNDKPKCIVS